MSPVSEIFVIEEQIRIVERTLGQLHGEMFNLSTEVAIMIDSIEKCTLAVSAATKNKSFLKGAPIVLMGHYREVIESLLRNKLMAQHCKQELGKFNETIKEKQWQIGKLEKQLVTLQTRRKEYGQILYFPTKADNDI